MELLDSRRLTGPSTIADGPGAILDVACEDDEARRFAELWKLQVLRLHAALGWPAPVCVGRRVRGGLSVAFSAAVDSLYAASEINEWAYRHAVAELAGSPAEEDLETAVARIRAAAADEANPELMQLIDEAASHGVTLLWDDDQVSLGLGRHSATWPAREIPDNIDWHRHKDVPVGLVTGTNGKTTTVRLATQILRTAGLNVGLSSTDWIAVNDRVLDRGDWSGPGGARTVLRETDVDAAILESARGGLLRRGLGVDRADAALITNIAEDHIGDFGSGDLDELLDIKWVVSRAVRHGGSLILNADDELLRARAADYRGEIVWFSLNEQHSTIATHRERGGTAFVLADGDLQHRVGDEMTMLCAAADIPITLGGAARHNVANALAAAALAHCLGASTAHIVDGLRSTTQLDNPGRCNVYSLNGIRILVDFAHNPAAMQALFDMARALPAKRRALCFGQAGDRPDELIREMTRDACRIGLSSVVVSELALYHRGRAHGDVYRIIRDELLRSGLAADAIAHHEEELDALRAAIDWARPGDLVIMLALGGAAPIQAFLKAEGAE